MQKLTLVGARPLGAAAVALAISVGAAGALSGPAAATEKAGSASVNNRTLEVTGTNGDDAITLRSDGASAFVTSGDPADVQRFNLADFDAVRVSLGNGNDEFTEQSGVLSTKTLTVDGGNGNDTMRTGDGADTILGGNGDDRVDAGRGNDTVSLGNGDDFFSWNPGEGSDRVDGGNGNADVMQFNGANVSETMSLTANGSQAVLLRDIGAIRMDTNDIEIVDVRALGGADRITVGNLQGTSIGQANIDLSGGQGGSDGQADTVAVDGTDRADRLTVTAQDGRVDVSGLPADTTVTGSDTQDHLQVNTLGGKDTVAVDPNVATLIGVGVDLGTGQS